MHILSRYVFRQTAGALLLILLTLTGVTWIAVALRQLELMTSQGQDALRFLAMTALAIPSMLALIAPIALLIASIHVINRLNGDSELIVMTAGGMPAWSLLKPLALLAFIVSLGISGVNHWVGPWSQTKLKDLAVQVRTDLMAQIIQPWRFTSPEAKLTVHIRDRAPDGQLLGLMMHDARDPKQVVTYLAERALIIKQDGQVFLRMDKGHIVRRLDRDAAPQIVAFDRYAVDANQLEQKPDQVYHVRPRQRTTPELLSPDPADPIFKANPGSYASELHERFASPLYTLTFVVLVVALMGQAQTTRASRTQVVVTTFAVAVLVRIVGITLANTLVAQPRVAPLLYAVPLGTVVLAAVGIQRHMYPRPPSRLARAADALTNRMGAVLLGALRRRRAEPGAAQLRAGS
jgi:lipopolysaccharide export system permease protein